jgi:hypothetical protein
MASLAIAGPAISSARGSAKAAAPPPADPTSVFKIGGNIGSGRDYALGQAFTDSSKVIRGFGTLADPFLNTHLRPALDPVDRFPAEDFSLVIPQQTMETFEQRMQCRILGLATLSIGNLAGVTLQNKVETGDDTTFEIVIAPRVQGFATLTCTNTRRTAAAPPNTGIRGLTLRVHGYALNDPRVVMPNPKFAWSQFSTLRMHDFTGTGNDYYQITPADRPTDSRRTKAWGLRSLVVRSVEDACRVCNECGTNLWYNMPAAANDAYMTEVATVIRRLLNPAKYVIFEMSNENWNYTFEQHDWWMSKTMEIVDGASYQYVHSKKPKWYSRTADVVTVETIEPHHVVVGDVILTNIPTFLTVTVTATPTPTSLSYAHPGSDLAITKVSGTAYIRAGRMLQRAARTGTVMTLKFGHDHGWAVGQTMKVTGVSGLAGAGTIHTVTGVPSPREVTLACKAGTDGNIALGGGTAVVAKFDSYLNAHDGDHDQFRLQRRLYARRTVEMSNLVRAVYTPAEWGVRAKIGLFNQPSASQYDQMRYIVAQHGQPNQFLHGIGQATYFFLDATKFGGPNLRNVSTYDGNTPPSIADYAMTLGLTSAGQKTKQQWDETCQVASDYGLKMWQYEFGPDITGSPVNTASVEARTQKMQTLFDPLFKPHYRNLLDELEFGNFEEVMVYQLGTVRLPTADEYSSWPIYQRFTEPSVRSEAIAEKRAAPRTGPNRNLLAATGTTEVSGKRTIAIYDDSAATFPTVVPGRAGTSRSWIITAPEAGNWTLSMQVESSNGVRDWFLKVNTVQQPPAFATPGTGVYTTPARVVALRKGINHIVTEYSSIHGGVYLVMRKLIFTRVRGTP